MRNQQLLEISYTLQWYGRFQSSTKISGYHWERHMIMEDLVAYDEYIYLVV